MEKTVKELKPSYLASIPKWMWQTIGIEKGSHYIVILSKNKKQIIIERVEHKEVE